MDIVIFGISGDLAEKKLIPAILELHKNMKFPNGLKLFGFSRTHKHLKHFNIPFEYQHVMGSYDNPHDMKVLKGLLRPDVRQLFYFALPPDASRDALMSINVAGLVSKQDVPGTRMILIEKPFGKRYEDAKNLIDFIDASFLPNQCLKVDHYAGKKELRMMGILALGGLRIKKVTFEILETATVENRGGYYDSVGALRDVGQNHLLFMLATFFKAFNGAGKREDVFVGLSVDPDFSKYKFGAYEGYDKIETFFSIPVMYEKMPIILRSGKALSKNRAAIHVEYENGEEKEIVLSSGTSAYEHVFEDAIAGNFDSFISNHEVLAAWKFIEEVEKIKETAKQEGHFLNYPVGSDVNSLLC